MLYTRGAARERRIFDNISCMTGGTLWRSWLRHCPTSQKVAGSIPDGVIGMFYNPSGRTVSLGPTQPPNRNEYQEYFLGVKAAGA